MNVDNFIKAITSSIEEVKTEKRLETALKKMDLFCPFTQCEMINQKLPKRKTTRRKRRKLTEKAFTVDGSNQKVLRKRSRKRKDSEYSEESEDSEESENSEDSEGSEDSVNREVGESSRQRHTTSPRIITSKYVAENVEEEIVIEKGGVVNII